MSRNILALGAHFDDVELGCAGTLIRHIKDGDNVFIMVLTNSAYSLATGDWDRPANVARAEGQKGADIIGATLVTRDFETLHLTYGQELIKEIDVFVEEQNIDTIYTHWDADVHQDHNAVGRATLVAGRRVNNIFMYRSNWYKSTQVFNEDFYVDISEEIDQKVEAIQANKSEIQKRGPGWIQFFKGENQRTGARCGIQYAEGFQTVKHMWDRNHTI